VKLPEGVTPVISDRDFTIATIAGSSAMKPEPTEEGAEPAEEEAEAEEEKGEEE
jgi:large subunit ribosomal protein L25